MDEPNQQLENRGYIMGIVTWACLGGIVPNIFTRDHLDAIAQILVGLNLTFSNIDTRIDEMTEAIDRPRGSRTKNAHLFSVEYMEILLKCGCGLLSYDHISKDEVLDYLPSTFHRLISLCSEKV